MLLTKLRKKLGNLYRKRKDFLWFCKRKFRKLVFGLGLSKPNANHYDFVILCVKNNEYAKLAIKNLNALHYYNPLHKITFLCDELCYKFWLLNKNKLDYPNQVDFIKKFNHGDRPWQYYKVEAFIYAARHNAILTDADEIWHGEFELDKDKVTFLVSPKSVKERENESKLVKEFFKKNEWLNYRVYTAAFISLPKKMMSDAIATQARKYVDDIMQRGLKIFKNKDNYNEMKRLAEQFAINLAVQNNIKGNRITILKKSDGPKDTNILQQGYYGCAQRITE